MEIKQNNQDKLVNKILDNLIKSSFLHLNWDKRHKNSLFKVQNQCFYILHKGNDAKTLYLQYIIVFYILHLGKKD